MSFAKLDRETQRTALLAMVYNLTSGVHGARVDVREQIMRPLSVDYGTIEKPLFYLNRKKLAIVGGGLGVRITLPGILKHEERVKAWRSDSKPLGRTLDQLFEGSLSHFLDREWERFLLFKIIGTQSTADSDGHADPREVEEDFGFPSEVYLRTRFYLEQAGLVQRPDNMAIQVTDSGEDAWEKRERQLSQEGNPEPSQEEYKEALLTSWSTGRDAYAGPFDIEHNDDYTWVKKGEREYLMPSRPAEVIRELRRGERAGQPWVRGEKFLQRYTQQAQPKMRDLFKPNHLHVWRDLVIADGKGNYRLNLD